MPELVALPLLAAAFLIFTACPHTCRDTYTATDAAATTVGGASRKYKYEAAFTAKRKKTLSSLPKLTKRHGVRFWTGESRGGPNKSGYI